MAITVMYRSKDFDPPNHDWYYVKYEPTGGVSEMQGMRVAGNVTMCIERGFPRGGNSMSETTLAGYSQHMRAGICLVLLALPPCRNSSNYCPPEATNMDCQTRPTPDRNGRLSQGKRQNSIRPAGR